MKKLLKDFKDFIDQGNVIDLAVGVIIGGAFKDVVNALVEKIITPIINSFGAGNAGDALGALQVKLPGGGVIEFGAFISSILSFILMAFIVFLIVKGVRKAATLRKKKEEEEEETTKTCPFCKSEIDIEATRCPHCTSELPEEEEEAEAEEETVTAE